MVSILTPGSFTPSPLIFVQGCKGQIFFLWLKNIQQMMNMKRTCRGLHHQRHQRRGVLSPNNVFLVPSVITVIRLLVCLIVSSISHLWDSESTLPWLSCLRTGTQILGKASIEFETYCKYSPPLQRSVWRHLGSLTLAEISYWLCLHPLLSTKKINAECINQNVT